MCVIIAKGTTDKKPTKSIITDCYLENDDLCGIAFVNPSSKLVTVFRGLTLDKMLTINDSLPNDTIAIYHFRIATSGVINIRNSHPFPLYAPKDKEKVKCRLALAHNGVIAGGDRKLSDTAKLVSWIEENQITDIDYILSLASGYNKFATLDYEGNLTLYGTFTEKYSMSFSNMFWDDYYGGNWYTGKTSAIVKNDSTSIKSGITIPNVCDICYLPPQIKLVYDKGLYLCENCLLDASKYIKCEFCQRYVDQTIELDGSLICDACFDAMKQ